MASPLSFHSTLGAASIGFSVSCGVFGVLTTQVFIYYQRYFLDKTGYKLVVAILWLLELVDQIFIGYSVYYYTITHYGKPLVLLAGDVVWTLIVQILVGNLVGTIVKCCFAMRVWRFSHHNKHVVGSLAFLILGQAGLAIAYCVRAFQLNKFAYADRLRVIASLSLGAGLVTDFLIAASLCIFLRKLRTGYRKSDSLINTLCIYAINTGALTGLISLLTLILYNTMPHTMYFIAAYFVLGKLYAISFLCTLNTRRVIRGKGTDQQSAGTGNSDGVRNTLFMFSPQVTRPKRSVAFPTASHTKSVEIGIHQEVSVVSDVETGLTDFSDPPARCLPLKPLR